MGLYLGAQSFAGGEHPLSICTLSSYLLKDVDEMNFDTFPACPVSAMLRCAFVGLCVGTFATLSPSLGHELCVYHGCCSMWHPHTCSSVIWCVLPPRAAPGPGLRGWYPVGSGELVIDLPVTGWSHLLLPGLITSGVEGRLSPH